MCTDEGSGNEKIIKRKTENTMLTFKEADGTITVSFPKTMNTPVCTQIEDELVETIYKKNQNIIFDMQGVEFISSMFLRLCQMVNKTVGKEKFELINISPNVMVVFKIAGYDQFLLLR
jgi:anti-anti-sigma factor